MSTTADLMAAIETILLTTKDASDADYFINTAAVKAVAMGDYQMLDKGVNYAAVLLPGKFGEEQAGSYYDAFNDDVLIDLFARYSDSAGTNWDNFTAFREAVRLKLSIYPTLNGVEGVTRVAVTADEDPGAIVKGKNPEASPIFILQRLRVAISHRVALSSGEYTP